MEHGGYEGLKTPRGRYQLITRPPQGSGWLRLEIDSETKAMRVGVAALQGGKRRLA